MYKYSVWILFFFYQKLYFDAELFYAVYVLLHSLKMHKVYTILVIPYFPIRHYIRVRFIIKIFHIFKNMFMLSSRVPKKFSKITLVYLAHFQSKQAGIESSEVFKRYPKIICVNIKHILWLNMIVIICLGIEMLIWK